MFSARALLRISQLTFVVVLALAGATTAAASSSIAASGTYTGPNCNFTSQTTDGTDTILKGICIETSWTGTFVGTNVAHATVTIHADGSGDGKAIETFTGTMAGRSGTLTFLDLSHGDPSGNEIGTLTIIDGTGGLDDLHGTLRHYGNFNSSLPFTYAGRIRFEDR